MALLIYTKAHDPAVWAAEIRALMPDLEIRIYPEIGNPNDIEAALVAKPPPGLLKTFPNLRLIHAFGATREAAG